MIANEFFVNSSILPLMCACFFSSSRTSRSMLYEKRVKKEKDGRHGILLSKALEQQRAVGRRCPHVSPQYATLSMSPRTLISYVFSM